MIWQNGATGGGHAGLAMRANTLLQASNYWYVYYGAGPPTTAMTLTSIGTTTPNVVVGIAAGAVGTTLWITD
jgi:hypothetical protein